MHLQHMALNMFGKNLTHEEQGGHGRRVTLGCPVNIGVIVILN